MNRKKVLDYTATRRTRGGGNQRDRGSNGDRGKQPFWSKDDKDLVGKSRDAVLKELQERITRKLMCPEYKDSSLLPLRSDEMSHSRGGSKGLRERGPIIDEFSEDRYDSHHDTKSRESADRTSRKMDASAPGKRVYDSGRSSYRDESPSQWKSRESKRSRNVGEKSGNQSDDDLRNMLKTYQRSKWDEDSDYKQEKRSRSDSKDYEKHKCEQVDDHRGVSSPSALFTMSSEGTLVSIPLEPLSDSREFHSREFDRDEYGEKERRKADGRESGYSSYSSNSRSRTGRREERQSLEHELRGFASDPENDKKLRYEQYDTLQSTIINAERELELGIGSELPYYRPIGDLGIGENDLRDLPISELAKKSGKRYKSAFELGKPFFGAAMDSKQEGWQSQEFGESHIEATVWNTPGECSFGNSPNKDDKMSLQRSGWEMMTQQLGRRSPDRKPSNSTRAQRARTEEVYDSEKQRQGDRQSADKRLKHAGINESAKPTPYTRSEEKTSKTMVTSSKKSSSTSTTQKQGPKGKLPLGFLPRQLKGTIGKGTQNTNSGGTGKVSDPAHTPMVNKERKYLENLPSKRSKGYVPKYTQECHSRSRSRSSERGGSKMQGSGGSTREVRSPSKPKFTTQNWLDVDNRDSKPPSKASAGLIRGRGRGGYRGRGSMLINIARGGGFKKDLSGRGGKIIARGRGRGIVFRGRSSMIRGRGAVMRGRGFVPRGRGKSPVGSTVRNIFRRSRSLSVSSSETKQRRSSVSPGSSRQGRKSRRNDKKHERRSRSSSFCSTCSSGSCSTCRSWGSASGSSGSRRGHRSHRKKPKPGLQSKKAGTTKADKEALQSKKEGTAKADKEASKSLDRIKADIKIMEKQLEQKKLKDVSQTEVKQENNKDEKEEKEKPKWLKDALIAKEEKEKVSCEVKKELHKTKGSEREVILKGDKVLSVTKRGKESPAREVKIVSKINDKGKKGRNEKLSSKMNIDQLEITGDRSGLRNDRKKENKRDKGWDRTPDSGHKSSKSPPGKLKKKEKLKSKKASKKAKKKKRHRDSDSSEWESVTSAMSGEVEALSARERKDLTKQFLDDLQTEDLFQDSDPKKIAVHYAGRRQSDVVSSGNSKYESMSEGAVLKNVPHRRNLINIPLPKEPDVLPQKLPQQTSQHVSNLYRYEEMIANPSVSLAGSKHPPLVNQKKDGANTEVLYAHKDATNVDWGTPGFTEQEGLENAPSDQGFGDPYSQDNVDQEWEVNQEENSAYQEYYYVGEEGVQEEYYSQEGYWEGIDQEPMADAQEGEYQEWCEAEYIEQGDEGEQLAQYYIGEDGQYYLVEGDEIQSQQVGEYVEGGEVQEIEDGYVYEGDGEYVYQYPAEAQEWQSEGPAYEQLEQPENWSGVEGEWSEEYQQGYIHEDGSEWPAEYVDQYAEYEATELELPAESSSDGVQGGMYISDGDYGEQYHTESYPPQEDVPEDETEQVPVESSDVEMVSSDSIAEHHSKDTTPASATAVGEAEDSKPLKSILKKPLLPQGNNQKSKLVTERLAQLKKQSIGRTERSRQLQAGVPLQSQKSVKEQVNNVDQGQATDIKFQTEQDRAMEEAILSSQPKDAMGTEYVVRVHGSGTAQFYCKLCRCHFNTLTAKNLHIKGMKHIELYIRLKSSLLQSVIKDTGTEKRPAPDQLQVTQKFPRRL